MRVVGRSSQNVWALLVSGPKSAAAESSSSIHRLQCRAENMQNSVSSEKQTWAVFSSLKNTVALGENHCSTFRLFVVDIVLP